MASAASTSLRHFVVVWAQRVSMNQVQCFIVLILTTRGVHAEPRAAWWEGGGFQTSGRYNLLLQSKERIHHFLERFWCGRVSSDHLRCRASHASVSSH